MSARTPLIGITSSELRRKEQVSRHRHGEPAQTEMALGLAYMKAIVAAGGLPVILTPVPAARLRALLARLDGVVLSGGPDLDPGSYGQVPHAQLGPTESRIDEFELALCAAARAAGTPLLGICRGMQALNVAGGGDLHQHVPEIAGGAVLHREAEPGEPAEHTVTIVPGSRLAGILGPGPLPVNSFHHQAVDSVAPGLRVAARACDGVIEALEGTALQWLFGVQWHAESLADEPRHGELFEALVGAAAGGDLTGGSGLAGVEPSDEPTRIAS
ncbi:MAG: gamma-glutamyl-gamma-aminobutyrate hydrolase family protein [Solirubrobacteraceae bacterium]